jgi:hypothetical protein
MTNQTANIINPFKNAAAMIFLLAIIALPAWAQGTSGGPCLLGVGNCQPNNNNSSNNSDPGGGYRYYDGPIAQEILRAHKVGSRYLLVLARYWDHGAQSWVEERAWVSGIRGSNGSRVAVEIGPSRKVFLRNNALSAPQVNQAEEYLQSSRNAVYKWLKYQEQLASYFNDPRYNQWAQQEYKRAEAWVNHYNRYIANTQAQVATSAP